jgi:hypothetical protein
VFSESAHELLGYLPQVVQDNVPDLTHLMDLSPPSFLLVRPSTKEVVFGIQCSGLICSVGYGLQLFSMLTEKNLSKKAKRDLEWILLLGNLLHFSSMALHMSRDGSSSSLGLLLPFTQGVLLQLYRLWVQD